MRKLTTIQYAPVRQSVIENDETGKRRRDLKDFQDQQHIRCSLYTTPFQCLENCFVYDTFIIPSYKTTTNRCRSVLVLILSELRTCHLSKDDTTTTITINKSNFSRERTQWRCTLHSHWSHTHTHTNSNTDWLHEEVKVSVWVAFVWRTFSFLPIEIGPVHPMLGRTVKLGNRKTSNRTIYWYYRLSHKGGGGLQ